MYKKKKLLSAQEMQEKIQQEISRIRLPRGKEVMGVIEQRHEGRRKKARCVDGKDRICRIPGRL